jgi:hypothetical protein
MLPMGNADPIIGAWKLNIAKSRFSQAMLKALNETLPHKKTEIYQEVDGQIVLK